MMGRVKGLILGIHFYIVSLLIMENNPLLWDNTNSLIPTNTHHIDPPVGVGADKSMTYKTGHSEILI